MQKGRFGHTHTYPLESGLRTNGICSNGIVVSNLGLGEASIAYINRCSRQGQAYLYTIPGGWGYVYCY